MSPHDDMRMHGVAQDVFYFNATLSDCATGGQRVRALSLLDALYERGNTLDVL